jgi:hypothetical protein
MVRFHGPEMVDTGVKNVFGLDCADDDNFKNSFSYHKKYHSV